MTDSTFVEVIAKIHELAGERFDKDVQMLKFWANQNSGTENHAGNEQMLEFVAEAFRGLPGCGRIMDIPSTHKTVGKGIPKYYSHKCRSDAPVQVLFNGHVDSVFSKDHRFQSCEHINENTLKGPGVTDMKGGLIIMLASLEIFENLADHPQIGWEILITCDEEIGSQNSRELLESAAERNHIGITFESSLPDQKLVRKRMGVGTYTTEVFGQSAHVGRNFREGRNAIVKLSEWIQEIHKINDEIDGVIVNAGVVSGGGPLNVVSEYAKAQFNLRVIDSVSEMRLFEQLNKIKNDLSEDGYTLKGYGQLNRAAKEAGPAFDHLFAAWQKAAEYNDMSLQWRDTGGGSDGNILQAKGLPLIDNLGAVGDRIHSSEEYIELDSLTTRSRLVASFLWMLSNGMFDDEDSLFANHVKSLQCNL